MLKKIAITGPESTGKSTLAEDLAKHYNTVWVPEYARTYLDDIKRPYTYEDLLHIAKGQIELEKELEQKAHKVLFSDTEQLVLKIWSENAYKKCHDFILNQLKQQNYDLYFLTNIDIIWEPDPQREHPHLRVYFFELYQKELDKLDINYVIISGNRQERLENAIKIIDDLLQK